jgi:hypothetical protein
MVLLLRLPDFVVVSNSKTFIWNVRDEANSLECNVLLVEVHFDVTLASVFFDIDEVIE